MACWMLNSGSCSWSMRSDATWAIHCLMGSALWEGMDWIRRKIPFVSAVISLCFLPSSLTNGTRVQIVPQLALRLSSLLFILFIYCLGSVLSVNTPTTSTIEKYHFSSLSSHTVRIFLSSNSYYGIC